MLTNKQIKEIESFVSEKPRSIKEIANKFNKNWRTIYRYIEKIKEEYGTIETRTFREGTRGALKIVYSAPVENMSQTVFQKELEEDINKGKTKHDFKPFDIFQHVPDKDKSAEVKKQAKKTGYKRVEKFDKILRIAKKEILFFSGNLSFINLKSGKVDIFKTLEELAKKEIRMKVVCRIDYAGNNNVNKLLSINKKLGKEIVEIRHKEQPLRITIIDNKIISMKEIHPGTNKKGELDTKTYVFYTIKNRDWIDWLIRIFWKMFNNSIGAEKRLTELDKIN